MGLPSLPHAKRVHARSAQNLSSGGAGGSRLETQLSLGGRGALPIWAAVGAIAFLVGALFVASLPAHYEQLRTVCTSGICADHQLTPDGARALQKAGRSVRFYAAYMVALEIAFAAVHLAISAVLVWRARDSRMAAFAALMLVTLGVALPGSLSALAADRPSWLLPVRAVELLGFASTILFLNIFPSARFEPRWTGWAALVWLAVAVQGIFFPGSLASPWLSVLNTLGFVGGAGASLAGLVYRYRRRADPVQRQQIKWVVFGVTTGLGTVVGLAAVFLLLGASLQRGPLAALAYATALYGAPLLIPVSLALAVLRARLWDVDPLINRTLVYGALTLIVVVTYVLVIAYLGALFRTDRAQGNLVISLAATGFVAILLQPLRERLQRAANRLLYGERDDPYAVLSRLSRHLEETLDTHAVLLNIVQTVRKAFKVPYVAITLRQDHAFATAAEAGAPVESPERLPLVYQRETVGELLIAPRAPGEPFGPADRRLLDDLASQAGVSAHAVRLTLDLQRSRERLVTAREEERRRLRRDLHDGLGPRLSGLALQLAAARNRVAHDPVAADLLADLKAQTLEAVADIRQLVYGLRPPALDELGLVPPIREHAARCSSQGDGLRITVEAPDRLPPLPAALEVAAYRIALEALTNVTRHAGARSCVVRLCFDDARTQDSGARIKPGPERFSPQSTVLGPSLSLEICDDGRGIAPNTRMGAGLISMRERADELGGTFTIDPLPSGGTRVCARLPLPATEECA